MKNPVNREVTIEYFILKVFSDNKVNHQYIPWQQGALLNEVNKYRGELHMNQIIESQLGRKLSWLLKKGCVERLKWDFDASKNIWVLLNEKIN